MRHKIKGKKLSRNSAHRRAMIANMSVALVMNEQIKTTTVKAKMIRPHIEKLVTKARKGTLAIRRDIISRIKDKVAAEKLMTVLANRYRSRPGGYTRVVKSGFRYGDRAPVAYIEFIGMDIGAKGCMTLKTKDSTEEKYRN